MEKRNQKSKNGDKEQAGKNFGCNDEELIRQAGKSKDKQEDERMEISISEFVDLNKKAKLCDEYQDKLMRLTAEFDNARKRMSKEKEDLIKFASQNLIFEILPIVDDFDRLIEGIKTDQMNEMNAAVLRGIKIIQRRIHELLEDNGLVRMKAIGEKFDPHRHEALMAVETDEYSEETIIEEIRSGYLLHDRVLRPAIVKVARKRQDSKEGTSAPEHKPPKASLANGGSAS